MTMSHDTCRWSLPIDCLLAAQKRTSGPHAFVWPLSIRPLRTRFTSDPVSTKADTGTSVPSRNTRRAFTANRQCHSPSPPAPFMPFTIKACRPTLGPPSGSSFESGLAPRLPRLS
jgi:hypothetical protein